MAKPAPSNPDIGTDLGDTPHPISGVRVERETMPAPHEIEWDGSDSARPTATPDFDLEVFGLADLKNRFPRLPAEGAIPMRTRVTTPDDLSLRLAFLLLHADGRSTIRQISSAAALPVDEVFATYLELSALGLVALGDTTSARA